jgi:hypothetical protein
MVFKPFKSPLIRNNASNPIEITDEPSRPAKKPRLDDEPSADAQPTPLASRKPLLQVSNRGAETIKQELDGPSKGDTSDERYFNVLWYAPTMVQTYPSESRTSNLRAQLTQTGANQPPKNTKHGMEMVFSPFGKEMYIYETPQARRWDGKCMRAFLSLDQPSQSPAKKSK